MKYVFVIIIQKVSMFIMTYIIINTYVYIIDLVIVAATYWDTERGAEHIRTTVITASFSGH